MKKSKVLLFLMLGIFVVFQSCQKNELINEKEKVIEEVGVSKINDEYTGQFKKEFTVSDGNGNTAFYTAYCKDENELNEFIENTKFTLTTNDIDIEAVKNAPLPNCSKKNKSNIKKNNDNGVTIELVTSNIKEGVQNISLNVTEQNPNKSTKTRTYKTSGDFIAIDNTSSSAFLIKTGVTDCYFCSWDWSDYYFDLYDDEYFWNYDKYDDYYKVGIIVRYDSDIHTYLISYNENEYRGNSCTIGTSNGGYSCYVGTPPAGTTAFTYPDKFGNFYYTRVSSGTTCPYPGSWYDGANCYVCDIPDYTTTMVLFIKIGGM